MGAPFAQRGHAGTFAGGHYGAATVVSMPPPPRIAVLDFPPRHICGKSQSSERRV